MQLMIQEYYSQIDYFLHDCQMSVEMINQDRNFNLLNSEGVVPKSILFTVNVLDR